MQSTNQSIAISLTRDLRNYAERKNLWYQPPHTNTTDKGDVCLEWRNDDRKLTAYVNTQSIAFLATTAGETEEIEITNLDTLFATWKWLCNN